MADLRITSNRTGNGPIEALADGDGLYVAEGVTVRATTGNAFTATTNADLVSQRFLLGTGFYSNGIYGTVIAQGYGLWASGGGHRIHIGHTGSITSQIDAIYLAGGGNVLSMDGRIVSQHGTGLNIGGAVGEPNDIQISGSVQGFHGAVKASGDDIFLEVTETGHLTASDTATVVALSGNNISLVNAGRIEGNYEGVLIRGSGTALIENSGVIATSVYAIGVFGSVATRIINTGQITGQWIELDAGNDYYDGRNGILEVRALVAGSGDDTLLGGVTNENFEASSGNDFLDGGAGHDTLYGGHGSDTIIGGAGNDWLRGDHNGASTSASDMFVFGPGFGQDTISDLDATDILDLTALGGLTFEQVLAATTDIPDESRDGVAETRITFAGGHSITLYNVQKSSLQANQFILTPPAEYPGGGDPLSSPSSLQVEFRGTSRADVLVGNAIDNRILGLGGHDRLYGREGHDQIWGHKGKDRLYGEAGNDTLFGGAHNDVLTGGKGKDVFVFDTKPNRKTNKDTIKDFNVKDDRIYLENKIFKKLGKAGSLTKPKKLAKDAFVKATKAQDAEDRIIYDKKSGALYYDPDGTGSAKQVLFATLSKNLKLTHHDFFVV